MTVCFNQNLNAQLVGFSKTQNNSDSATFSHYFSKQPTKIVKIKNDAHKICGRTLTYAIIFMYQD